MERNNNRLFCIVFSIALLFGLMFIPNDIVSVRAQTEPEDWTQFKLFSGDLISSIVIDPTNPLNIYIASSTVGFGVHKTIDGGQSWNEVNNGLPGNVAVASLALDPINTHFLYASTYHVGNFSPGAVYKSIDGGDNWDRVLIRFEHSDFTSVAVDPINSGIIYTIDAPNLSPDHVFKSEDGGQSWYPKSNGLYGVDPVTIVVDPVNSNILYVTAASNGVYKGIYKSTNGGDSWVPINNGLPISVSGAFAINPADNQILYAGVRGTGGVYKSTYGGSTTNENSSWSKMAEGLNNAWIDDIVLDPGNPDTLYAGAWRFLSSGATSFGVYRTVDGAMSWTPMNEGFPQNLDSLLVTALAIDPVNSKTLLAGTTDGLWAYTLKSNPIPPPPTVEKRDIVFIRGIDSEGTCDGANDWVKDYLANGPGKSFFRNVEVEKYLNFNYAGGGSYNCSSPGDHANEHVYETLHTCDGVYNAATELKDLIEREPTAKVTIVAHSMGGLVAAHLVATSDRAWVESHIASVITFDSPLRGVPGSLTYLKSILFLSDCNLTAASLADLKNDSAVVLTVTAARTATIVPFYHFDAINRDRGVVQVVQRESTWLEQSQPFHQFNLCGSPYALPEPNCQPPLSVEDDHLSIWDNQKDANGLDKAFFVGCAVAVADNCNILTVRANQDTTTSTQIEINPGISRVQFSSNYGSIVRMTLISPDGTVYGPDGTGPVAAYAVDTVSEVYEIADPAPGTWTIELLGVEVAPEGEDVGVAVVVLESSEPEFQIPPTANAGGPYVTEVGQIITFNGIYSSDSDGIITLYEWDFDSDGVYDFSSTDPIAEYTYPTEFFGNVILQVTDDDGLTGTDTVSIEVKDVTPPTIMANVSGTVGDNGWYTSNVVVNWTITDDESSISFTNGCEPTDITNDTSEITLSCEATSGGGTNSETVTIKQDGTQPTIAGSSAPTPNTAGWNNTDVTVSFTCNDNLSGIANCGPNQTLSGEGANQEVTGIATDNAGNSASTTVSGINIDKTPPSVSVIGVTDGATYTLGDVPAISCDTQDGLSGADTPAALSLSGGTINGVGLFTAMCDGATDNAGNVASTSVNYTVEYNFSGFFSPVDNPPVFNSAKAGKAIPVKFSLNGDQGPEILADGYPVSQQIPCDLSVPPNEIEETVTAGSSDLSYDADNDQYNYIWKTDQEWANSCRQLVVRLDDDTDHIANFEFK